MAKSLKFAINTIFTKKSVDKLQINTYNIKTVCYSLKYFYAIMIREENQFAEG